MKVVAISLGSLLAAFGLTTAGSVLGEIQRGGASMTGVVRYEDFGAKGDGKVYGVFTINTMM